MAKVHPMLPLASLFLAAACGTAKHGIADGRYRMDGNNVVVEVVEDTILIAADDGTTGGASILRLPPAQRETMPELRLVQHSFDLDLLTIPVKYRPAAADLQPQLETQVSIAMYLGRRTDRYRYTYEGQNFARKQRSERHLGVSFGVVGGLGGANIGPDNTQGMARADYVGVVGNVGLAFIGAWNNATLGVVVGQDHLLNSDRVNWVFQRQPWVGVTLGLNLN